MWPDQTRHVKLGYLNSTTSEEIGGSGVNSYNDSNNTALGYP